MTPNVDDRKDIKDVSDSKILNSADSTVVLINTTEINDNGDGTSTLKTEKYKDRFGLCSKERFANQPVSGFCSGFLIKDDIIATAAHCVKNEKDLKNILFVFGYKMISDSKANKIIKNSDIYKGSKLLGRKFTQNGTDWALIKLEKKVKDHKVVNYRKTGKIENNEEVYVIGHPCGLPLKFAPGANVRKNSSKAFFTANLDTYGGNSGSPVFNAKDHTLEGILVRGETDFVESDNNCNISLVCPSTGCIGEDVTRVSEFLELLENI